MDKIQVIVFSKSLFLKVLLTAGVVVLSVLPMVVRRAQLRVMTKTSMRPKAARS